MNKLLAFVICIIFMMISSLSFTQDKASDKDGYYAKERAKEVAKVDKVLQMTDSDIARNYRFGWKNIDRGIFQIRNGNPSFLKKITYDKLLIFLRGLMLKAGGGSPLNLLTAGTLESQFLQGVMGGLENKDPRVRLFALITMKTINLTESMYRKIIVIMDRETDHLVSYHYVDMDLNSHFGNLKVEVFLLRKVLRRTSLRTKLLVKKTIHPSVFIGIKRFDFSVLADRIGNEPESDIPLTNFTEADINYLIAGLLNKDAYIKQRCAEYIYDIYNLKTTSRQTRQRIDKLISKPFNFETEAINHGYRMAFIRYKTKYPGLALDGSKMLKIVFRKKDEEKASE